MNDDSYTAELYDDGSWNAYRRRGQWERTYAGGQSRSQLGAYIAIAWHTIRERRRTWNPS